MDRNILCIILSDYGHLVVSTLWLLEYCCSQIFALKYCCTYMLFISLGYPSRNEMIGLHTFYEKLSDYFEAAALLYIFVCSL